MPAQVNRKTVAHATLWTILDFILERGANFVIIVILARLLSPVEFGTVALLAVFIALAALLSESGFGQALIQRSDLSPEDISTAFWCNVGLAVAMVLLLYLSAPWIAAFFSEPQLVPLMHIMGGSVLLGALGAVQRALLLRNLEYRRLLIVRVIATLSAGAVAVTLAYSGYGVFSLAFQSLTLAAITTVLLWITSQWRPHLIFSRTSARQLFGFGGFMLASSILETIYSRAYTIFIGRMGDPAVLGLYGRADATLQLTQGFVTYPINQVAFPAFAKAAGEPDLMRQGMRSAMKTANLLNIPAMMCLAALADPFVRGVYGEQWAGAVPFIQILSLGGMLAPIHMLNLQALMAIGRSDLFFTLELAKKIIGISILFTASFWGPIGIAWGVVAAGYCAIFINTIFSGREFGYGLFAQFKDAIPGIMLAIGMAGSVFLVLEFGPLEQSAYFLRLVLGGLVGALIWAVLALGLDLGESRKLLSTLRKKHSS
ncbi:lipopolysaccharide biosynthesis protein [Erythrobacter sp. MTPC3]|uniref:lipopolysaccharide biosynthesis protein n=1 Tax=Erythrobacter sp. MTPC3 TaxID=3056564 RepID=UPI0036F1C8A6